MSNVVVVGASVSGVKVVRELRAGGFTGDVTLVGDEAEEPYDKPPLSKEALRSGPDSAVRLLTAREADDLGISLHLGRRATRLDVAAHEVVLDGRDRLAYDTIVLATGASPLRLFAESKAERYYLRTLRDCVQLGSALRSARSVAVVGAGFIGTEVASTARDLGVDVHLIDGENRPLSKVLGEEVGGWFTDRLAAHGINLQLGSYVEAIKPGAGGNAVSLADGTRIRADVVVLGVGVQPNIDWLSDSGVSLSDGLLCDQFGRLVGQSDAYAVGDVARWFDPRYDEYVRYEHWTSAVGQALTVARNITRPEAPEAYSAIPYIWSDVCGERIQILGRTGDDYECSVVGDFEARPRFVALYSRSEGGGLCGAVAVNWPKAVAVCRSALECGDDADAVLRGLYNRREAWLPG